MGNDIHYPPQAKVGRNCLFGTKAMLPVDGPIREDVGLLGSPPFEIPRDTNVDFGVSAAEIDVQRRERLPAKDRSNIFTALSFLSIRMLVTFQAMAAVYVAFVAFAYYGVWALALSTVMMGLYGILFLALIERMSLRFRRMEPRNCTLYDPYFWKVEHFWKHCENGLISLFPGTPFKPMISRLLGMKVGKRVLDLGMQASERNMVEVGDHTILNEGVFLQCHSLEDGFFKSDRIKIGSECSVGVKGFVHYGTEMRDGSILEADSFLMKGEVMAASSVWQGNPARAT